MLVLFQLLVKKCCKIVVSSIYCVPSINHKNNLGSPSVILNPYNKKLKPQITTVKIDPNDSKHSPNKYNIRPNNNKLTKYSTKSTFKNKK